MILKPVVIISIIFSITIVLAGIGITAMTGTVETLPVETFPVTPAQQMNVESEETFLVDSYIQKESEDTSIPMQNYIALQEKAARAEHITPQIETDKFEDPPPLRRYLGSIDDPSKCSGKMPYLNFHLNENPLKLERYLIQNPSTGECRYKWAPPLMTQEELDALTSQRLSMAAPVSPTFILEVRENDGLVPKDVDVMWMDDSIFFDPKVHDNCSELFPTFDLLGVDKFRIMYVRDGAALNCLVKTSEELERIEELKTKNSVFIVISDKLKDNGNIELILEGNYLHSNINKIYKKFLTLTEDKIENYVVLDYNFKINEVYTLTAINGDYSTSITWTPLP
jgi:hypothetical protein